MRGLPKITGASKSCEDWRKLWGLAISVGIGKSYERLARIVSIGENCEWLARIVRTVGTGENHARLAISVGIDVRAWAISVWERAFI